MADYSDIIFGQGGMANVTGGAPAAAPAAPMPTMTPAPTRDPQEIEARKTGWSQVLMKVFSDPNFGRALGMFGSSLAQPLNPGESRLSRFGQSMFLGQNAYDFGKQAEFERGLATSKEQREQAESQSLVGYRGAQTAQTEQATGQARRMEDDVVARAKTEAEKAKVDLGSARTEADRKRIQLEHEQRIAEIKKSIPNDRLRQGLEAEIDKSVAAVLKDTAAANQSNATARFYGARGAQEEQIVQDLSKMTPEQRLQYHTKSGPYATGLGSAQVQMAEYFKKLWKSGNPRGGVETEQAYDQRASKATEQYLTQAKAKPDFDAFIKWAEQFGSGDFNKDYQGFLRAQSVMGRGGTPGATPGTRVRRMDKNGNLIEGGPQVP